MILGDTSGLLSAIDGSQRHHRSCREALEGSAGPVFVSPFVLAELDYLIATHIGMAAEIQFLREVAGGAYEIVGFSSADVGLATDVIEQYRALDLGLADASIVVLADRLGIQDVLTLDERHFRSLTGLAGKPFRLLPADE